MREWKHRWFSSTKHLLQWQIWQSTIPTKIAVQRILMLQCRKFISILKCLSCFRISLINGDQTSNMDTLVIFPTQPGNEIKRLVGYDTDTGAIWGLATDREHQVLFTSAFFKRHVGLSPEGLGGLFLTDLQSGTTNFWADAFDLGTFFGDEPTGRDLSGLDQAFQDPKAYANVSKIGIGDMEYDGRGETLYFVNLWDKKIYGIADVDPDLPPTTLADLVDANGWVVDTAAEHPVCHSHVHGRNGHGNFS